MGSPMLIGQKWIWIAVSGDSVVQSVRLIPHIAVSGEQPLRLRTGWTPRGDRFPRLVLPRKSPLVDQSVTSCHRGVELLSAIDQ